ncbi:MAG: nuclear transport factor 2 family protein [Thermohalobaculum sp.]|nr:nuclear transport factor 2 family protein [Thermohalobaculum sp.]
MGGELDFFLELETGVWEALAAGDGARDGAALAPDFLGVYPDGFATRDEHVAQLDGGPTVASFALSAARLIALGADHALLCYCATFTRAGGAASERMLVSSVWRRTTEGWRNVFSQDTPVAEATPPRP